MYKFVNSDYAIAKMVTYHHFHTAIIYITYTIKNIYIR